MSTPHFIPFEAMTDAEQREHLRRVHGLDEAQKWWSQRFTQHRADHGRLLDGPIVGVRSHTHDKPTRSTT